MPVRNAAATIEAAADSILRGTFQDLELIAVDDDSSDPTPEILRALGRRDRRLRLIHNPRPGLIHAVNLAVSLCRAPIIARMDADDISLPDRLEKQFHYLERHSVDGVSGRVKILDQSGQTVASLQRYESWVNDNLDPEAIAACRFVESPLVNPSVMVRKEVFELGHRDGPWPEDYEFWLRALHQGFRFAKLTGVVLHWLDGPGRLTRTHPRYSPEAFDRCRRMHLLQGPLQGHRAVDLWGAGQTGKPWLRWLLGEGFTVRHILEVSPRKIGQTMESVPVVAPDSMPRADGTPLLVAVGAEGARELILRHLEPRGYVPGQDTWFVA